MLDAYSFDANEEGMAKSYDNVRKAFLEIFEKIGMNVIPTMNNGFDSGMNNQNINSMPFSNNIVEPNNNVNGYNNQNVNEMPVNNINPSFNSGMNNNSSMVSEPNINMNNGIFICYISYTSTHFLRIIYFVSQ